MLRPLRFLHFGLFSLDSPVSPMIKNETIAARRMLVKLDLSLYARQGI